jgi:hypothetical protein
VRNVLLVLLAVLSVLAVGQGKPAVKENEASPFYKDLVPDKETAVALAEILAVKIYGKENIAKQKPLVAKRVGANWVVEGTFHTKPGELRLGGVVLIKLQAKDCKVLRVTHGK